MSPEIIKFAKRKNRTIAEIVEKFNIDNRHIATLRRRLKEKNIKTLDNRGRKKIDI